MWNQRIEDENSEFIEWLEVNYPQEAQRLVETRDKNPQRYGQTVESIKRRYLRIFEAEQENPELARILKAELQTRDKQEQLLGKIRVTTDENEKKKLTEELKVVLSDGYDLIVRRKQLEYDQLLKKLEQLKEEIAKSQEDITTWKESTVKNERVNSYLNDLLKTRRRWRWD